MLKKDYNIQQIADKKVLEIFLYDEIQGDYYNWFGDLVESKTSAKYIQKALDKAGAVDEINVYINSIGGSVLEGVAIFNKLKRIDIPVTVYIDAFAFSVASVIAMAGDKVVMPSNATMMIHNAMMSAFGNSDELRKAADDLDVMNEGSCNSYLVKAGDKLTKEKLTELLNNETFLTADEALAYGLIDEIENPVDLNNSVEIVEQARKNRNLSAKFAAEKIVNFKATPPPKSNLPEITDKFDIAMSAFKKSNLFKGELKND